MQYIIIISLVFILYLTFIIIRFGVLPSISESFYRLPGWQWILFTLFTWGLGLPLILIEKDLLLTLSGVSLLFLGGSGAFKMDRVVKSMHNLFALLAILFSFMFLIKSGLTALFLIFLLCIIVFLDRKNEIWWIEVSAFVFIVIGLLIVV